MAQPQPARRKTQPAGKKISIPVSIPDKLYFRIGDVARLCALPAYVLRFWETEFPRLKPNKGGTGQRLYRKHDVELILEIKHLLYNEGFTIAGARRLLVEKRRVAQGPGHTAGEVQQKSSQNKPASGKAQPLQPSLHQLRTAVREILGILNAEKVENAANGQNGDVPRGRQRLAAAKQDVKTTRRPIAQRNDAPTLF